MHDVTLAKDNVGGMENKHLVLASDFGDHTNE